ncbi:D-alanine--D-alanine ligase [Myxococcota bacterium]|nr:D-alanine--D-alanine ligase [Myxococcota bacterium]
MKLAVLYNPPGALLPGEPIDKYAEHDGEETIRGLCGALERLGHTPTPVIADRRLPWRLDEGGFDAAFNIAEGEGRRSREAIPAAVCELLGVPYTHSDPLTLAVCLDKDVARRLVSSEVRVARGGVVSSRAELVALGLRFPVIVKPNDEGSSKGIRGGPLAADEDAAWSKVRWLTETYGCPVLVEELVTGAEVTVGLRGNGDDVELLGITELGPVRPGPEPFVYTHELKTDPNYAEHMYIRPTPQLPADQLQAIEGAARAAFRLLGCRDVARVDLRLNDAGEPVFLECNPIPGLKPGWSDLVLMTRDRMSYDELIGGVLVAAQRRWSKP